MLGLTRMKYSIVYPQMNAVNANDSAALLHGLSSAAVARTVLLILGQRRENFTRAEPNISAALCERDCIDPLLLPQPPQRRPGIRRPQELEQPWPPHELVQFGKRTRLRCGSERESRGSG